MDGAAILDSRLLQAFVAGLFLGLGWMVNGWQNRRADTRRRHERLRDAHRAIYSEIAAYLENLGSEEALQDYRASMTERMEDDPAYVPLIPRERNDTIFRALVEEIYILPRVTIDPIVSYYSQLFAIETLIEDMRGKRFPELEPSRRIQMYSDYIDLKIQAFHDGHFALRMIAAFAEGGRDGAKAEEQRIARELSAASNPSSQGADPSGRSQG